MLPGKDVWRLLLGQWTQPDQQLLCRLLCTSTAMAHLVGELCVGKAAVKLSRRPRWLRHNTKEEVAAAGATYRSWLAKHARLLGHLESKGWDEQQPDIAAGVCAAAGMPLAPDAAQQGMLLVPAAAAAATPAAAVAVAMTAAAASPAAAAAAAGAAAEPQGAGTGLGLSAQLQAPLQWSLPLASLELTLGSSHMPNMGSALVPVMEVCPHLAKLALCLFVQSGAGQGSVLDTLASGFASLQNLQQLDIAVTQNGDMSRLDTYADMSTASFGSQLTKLQLAGVRLSAGSHLRLPSSLQDLRYMEAVLDLSHLTSLTRLECIELHTQ